MRDLNPDISPALDTIIAKLLAKDPSDRYQSGRSLLADLRTLAKLNRLLKEGKPIRLGEHGREAGPRLPQLVGRDTELEELLNALDSVVNGRGELALIEEGGGAGKSLLSEEFLRRALSYRPLVITARCEERARPFAPVRDSIERFFLELERLPAVQRERLSQQLREFGFEIGRYLSRLGPLTAAFFASTDPEQGEVSDQFLEATANFLIELGRLHGCLIWMLDDAHHLDEASHQVLRRVRAKLEESPVMILATARNSPEAELSRQSFRSHRVHPGDVNGWSASAQP